MNIDDIVNEGATAVLFHYAGITSARDILRNGVFKLSSTTGNPSEAGYAPKGYQYFLSTTRSKVGDYHRFVGSGAAMFVLDGNWFAQRYPVKPIDYWERSWVHSPGRTRESEDRVFSQDNEIPIDGVRALHVLLKEQSEVRSPATREMLIIAKQRGIPAYLYMDESAWRLQDTRRAVTVGQAAAVLKGPQPSHRSYRSRNFLEEILEMIFKKAKGELTDGALKRVRNLLIYGSRHPNEDDGLGVDMSNARKPGSSDYESAVKINQFMRANGLKNTVELKNFLVRKWEATDFFKEDLDEAFNQPYRLRWEHGDHGDVDAVAKLDDGNYLSIMFNKGFDQETKEEAWSVEFWRNNSQEVTGEGDAQRVFATVLSAIQKFIKKYKPNKVFFAASTEVEQGQNAQSRARLYDSLVQRYAKAWGFRAFRADTGNKIMYELSRIKQDVEEDISRRGFLGGIAGAAALGTATDAQAAPTRSVQPQSAPKAALNPTAQMVMDVAKKYITNSTELAQFMAQCAVESTNFNQLVEVGTGRTAQEKQAYFNRKYDAFDLHGKPKPPGAPGVKAAKVLGNTQPGDGERFKGRGFIQLTGRWNYTKAGEQLSKAFNQNIDLTKRPELLENPKIATYASLWFWLNRVAPKVKNFHDTAQVSRKVNGAVVKSTHQKRREANFKNYQSAVQVAQK
jgi:predicted chitinase